MTDAEGAWASLASRVARVALTRKDISYASMVDALATIGVADSERALVSRVSRGTLRLAMFLQILVAAGNRRPRLWLQAINEGGDWSAIAQRVIQAELAQRADGNSPPIVTTKELVRRLSSFGAPVTSQTLNSHIVSGTMPLALFLQCITALNSRSLDDYIDFEDLLALAYLEK
ncbi:DUF6471 domain-containing protein [Caballeronia hypogeia]|nr:DUF6471 domain-containing protein [Caballeronia hypogeia]